MERQTRQLLGVLSDGLTDELLTELSSREMLETELQLVVSGSRQSVGRRLRELEIWGVVVSEDRRTPGRGRPTRAWRLASTEVASFLEGADELLLRMLEDRTRRHREAIRLLPDEGKVRRLRP